jgi:hypothetical protein
LFNNQEAYLGVPLDFPSLPGTILFVSHPAHRSGSAAARQAPPIHFRKPKFPIMPGYGYCGRLIFYLSMIFSPSHSGFTFYGRTFLLSFRYTGYLPGRSVFPSLASTSLAISFWLKKTVPE